MRTRQVTRFYCDFCPRATLTKKSMERHELMCIYRADRVCPLCKEVKEDQPPLASIIRALEEKGLEEARYVANHCPACLLAAVVQYNRTAEKAGEIRRGEGFTLDYQAELASWRHDNDEAHGGPF